MNNDKERQFIKSFERLCYSRSSWQVWADMVTMFACTISNAVDKTNFDRREKMYMDAVGHYEPGKIDAFAEMFANLVEAMEANPYQDFLGINYQRCAIFAAQDIDPIVAMMCYVQLSLIGCAAYVKIANSLTHPMTGHPLHQQPAENLWLTPMYFSDVWHWRRVFGMLDKMTPIAETAQDDVASIVSAQPIILRSEQISLFDM